MMSVSWFLRNFLITALIIAGGLILFVRFGMAADAWFRLGLNDRLLLDAMLSAIFLAAGWIAGFGKWPPSWRMPIVSIVLLSTGMAFFFWDTGLFYKEKRDTALVISVCVFGSILLRKWTPERPGSGKPQFP